MRSTWLLSGLLALLAVIPASAQQTAPADQTTQASAAAPADPTPAAAPADPAPAATPAPAQAPTTPPAASTPPVWSLGPVDFSGTLDMGYTFNFNHPRPNTWTCPSFTCFSSDNSNEPNYLYNFNDKGNAFNLNFVKLGMSHSPDPSGFRIRFGVRGDDVAN